MPTFYPTVSLAAPIFRRAVLASCLLAGVAVIAGCGASKPKPAKLEDLQSVRQVTVAWSHRVDSVDLPSAISVVGDTVVAGSTGGELVALDRGTGQVRWSADLDTKLTSLVGGDGRFAAVVSQDNELVVLDQGKVTWRERQSARVATPPFIAGERVFVQSVDRQVRAYDALDGRWLWAYQRAGGEALSLAVPGVLTHYRDTLLVGQGARLVGLDPVKGSPRFEVNLGTPRGSNEVERLADLIGPAQAQGDDLCVRAFQLSVGCVNAGTGALRWSRPQAGTQAVAANANLVVGADGADRITAWKAATGDLIWRVERFTHRALSAMTVWGDVVAFADDDGYLHLLALDDGRTVGRFSLDAPLATAPLVKDGLLFAQTRRGTVYALRSN